MPKPVYIRGEILPPLSQEIDVARPRAVETSNQDLNLIATWLDDRFEIPGTGTRFGLDALIGWIPGIGDALAAAASLFIVVAAWKRGAARITLLRMSLNLTIENVIGVIPVIGDLAHVAWKAWIFVIGMVLFVLALFLGPIALIVYVLRSHWPLFSHR